MHLHLHLYISFFCFFEDIYYEETIFDVFVQINMLNFLLNL